MCPNEKKKNIQKNRVLLSIKSKITNCVKMGEEKEKMKEKEINTDSDFEKPELTDFGKFCQRHGINNNLIMLKITLFVMYGGKIHKISLLS